VPGQTRSGSLSQKPVRKKNNKDEVDSKEILNRHKIETNYKMNEIHFCLSALPHHVNKKFRLYWGCSEKIREVQQIW
jgi:hypothetical protein